MKDITCCNCYMVFGVPERFEDDKREDGETFYCPSGHPQSYPKGESDLSKMRRERDRLKQRVAEEMDATVDAIKQRDAAKKSASAQKGQVTKLKNRAKNGVCPCCNRSFTNLKRHMDSQHPEFGDNVVKLKTSGSKGTTP